MRPEVSYRYHLLGSGPAPLFMPAADLTQALLNLLNNAADACPDRNWISVLTGTCSG
jgi:two-component system, sensor histidine kinase RegB